MSANALQRRLTLLENLSSLRTAHRELLLRIIGFRRKDRNGYKPLSYREVLERTGPERIETTIWKRQLEFAGALVRQGDSRLSKRVLFGRLAADGARAQARRSTGDVVGGLPPEKSRGLRGGPTQRQRTEVGRIRSCCQGWTGLNDCCKERGQVAPGGREGSGSTRQRLATRGPSSIQRAAPARG